MKQLMKTLLFLMLLYIGINSVFGVEEKVSSGGVVSQNNGESNQANLNDGDISIPGVTNEQTAVDKILGKRKEEINKLIGKPNDEKDIEAIKNVLSEIEIKKDLNKEFLEKIDGDLQDLKVELKTNVDYISLLEGEKERSGETELELQKYKIKVATLERQVAYKLLLINDLEKTIDSLGLLKSKYDNLLEKYVEIKKTTESDDTDELKKKLNVLYFVIGLTFLLYITKYFLAKKFVEHERKFLYFDLIYGVFLVLFLVSFFFYLFPQLYIMLIFISGYLMFINQAVIGSFISSLVIFRKYKIGDVIEHDEKIGKIIRITPVFTIVRTMNKYGILTSKIINIPNIMLVRDRVIILRTPTIADHEFSIILSIKNTDNIFKIMKEIEQNILVKSLNARIQNINPEDNDIFKISHEQLDIDKLKITFYWRATAHRSRKIEKKILGYLKFSIDIQKIHNEEKESTLEVGILEKEVKQTNNLDADNTNKFIKL